MVLFQRLEHVLENGRVGAGADVRYQFLEIDCFLPPNPVQV